VSYSKIILKDRPDIVWPLDNITDSSSVSNAINFFNNTSSQYSASINVSVSNVLEVPIVFGGGTALRLSSSSVAGLSIPLMGRFSEIYSGTESSIEFWIRCDKITNNELTIAKKRNFNNIGLFLRENYLIFRYGNSSSYMEASYGLAELDDPTHVVMNAGKNSIELIVNGRNVVSTNFNNISLPIDANHSINDYMDFYGNESYNVIVDCVAIYPFTISRDTAKRHYVYGLGKSIDESIFFNLGGDFYNLSTISTRKSYFTYWDVPQDWSLSRYDNLINTTDGITVKSQPVPVIYSYDNNIIKTGNKISFFSSSPTRASYIDMQDAGSYLGYNNRPFFAKFILNGELPRLDTYQTLMSYSRLPFNELLNFNLKNSSGSYYLQFQDVTTNYTASLHIPNPTSSPTIYVGMRFNANSKLYFGLSGSVLQSASFNYPTGSAYVLDPLTKDFPATSENIIRIGSRYTYDLNSNILDNTDINQFYGTFVKFMVCKENLTASTVAELDAYTESPYSVTHDTNEDRLKTYSFGHMDFIMHGSRIADSDSGSAFISSNRISFGYPDSVSGSQVRIYGTLLDYNDNVVYPKTQLSKINHLEWINLRNINSRYIKFDIDIASEDSNRYPPFVKYFTFESYPMTASTASYTEIFDDGGDFVKIMPSASSNIFLPEEDRTPSIFIKDSSGIKVYRNNVDIQFSPQAKLFNPKVYSNMALWLDSRFVNGQFLNQPSDSYSLNSWIDSSGQLNSASTSLSNTPSYRLQSLNLLKNNESNGGEDGLVSNLDSSNNSASIFSSNEAYQSGQRSFKIVPNGTTNNSFIDIYSASTLSPNSVYTAIGTVILNKPQEATSLNARSRSILIDFTTSSFVSTSASNLIGSHSVSVSFTTPSVTSSGAMKIYNGSASPSDAVYWDNLAIYSGSGGVSGSPTSWYSPYEHYNDREALLFSSSSRYSSALTASQPITIYIVARSLEDGGIIGGHSASAPSIYISSGSYTMSAGQIIVGPSNNKGFNFIAGVFNTNSSSLFINDSVYSGNIGTGSFNSLGLVIGRSIIGTSASSFFNGHISAVMVYLEAHDRTKIDYIKEYMRDSFNV
jgi:hypothetical protein